MIDFRVFPLKGSKLGESNLLFQEHTPRFNTSRKMKNARRSHQVIIVLTSFCTMIYQGKPGEAFSHTGQTTSRQELTYKTSIWYRSIIRSIGSGTRSSWSWRRRSMSDSTASGTLTSTIRSYLCVSSSQVITTMQTSVSSTT